MLKNERNRGFFMKFNTRNIALMSFDSMCFALIAAIYHVLSGVTFDGVDVSDMGLYLLNAGILLLFTIVCRLFFAVYFTVWRYTHTPSYLRLIVADLLATVLAMILTFSLQIEISFWFFATVAPLNVLMAISARYCSSPTILNW